MNRVVLDTNVIVSALLVPAGIQASILLLGLRGDIGLYVSAPVLGEYEDVLRRPRFKLQPRQIEAALRDIREIAHFVAQTRTLSISIHESDNRILECADAAEADYLVTGNIRHFPQPTRRRKLSQGVRSLIFSRDPGIHAIVTAPLLSNVAVLRPRNVPNLLDAHTRRVLPSMADDEIRKLSGPRVN